MIESSSSSRWADLSDLRGHLRQIRDGAGGTGGACEAPDAPLYDGGDLAWFRIQLSLYHVLSV